MEGYTRHPASYKDPSGFVFFASGKIYRQVNKIYTDNYDHLISSGLYELLQKNKMLLAHEELKQNLSGSPDWYLTLQPEEIKFWSYPYEWCFEQLKDAALLTLEILNISIEKSMILKDATPLNIQFINGKPVFIDSLSFEKYDESVPWIAYRQYCENFLFPLWLSHYHKMNFSQLFSIYPEGISAEITEKLLPAKSVLNPAIWMHVYLQKEMSKKKNANNTQHSFTKKKLQNIITHLESIIKTLDNTNKTTWSGYYKDNICSTEYLIEKEKIILDLLPLCRGKKLLDIGANEGQFSILAANNGFDVVAIDNDEQCINNLYSKIKQQKISGIIPLCMDICNPPAGSGFANTERSSFNHRAKPDIVLALALIHHLVIGKNIPLNSVAEYLFSISPQLIIEFVPKEDEKTQLLLLNKKDIYPDYTQDNFENIFQQLFFIEKKVNVVGTNRVIYLMRRITNL